MQYNIVVDLIVMAPNCSLQYFKSSCFIQLEGVTRNFDKIWVNIGSDNGLMPDATKPLPEPLLNKH